MAWKERDRQLRRMESINGNIDTCLIYLKEFSEIYRPNNPKYADFADKISEVLINTQTMVENLKKAL